MSEREEQQAELSRIVGKVLKRIEEYLDREEKPDVKDLKTVTGALKELQSMWEEKNETHGGALTVRFEGETEEMSE